MLLTLKTGPEKTAEIHTGPSVFMELTTWLNNRASTTDSIFILTDTNTRSCCLDPLLSAVPSLKSAKLLEIPAGEKNKSLKIAGQLWKELAGHGASRRSLLISLGGGVITDLGGFVASTFNRGIPFIHIPTTLLGMVDAAIGGKNGINLGDVKNQVGTFQHPDAVFIFSGFLETLDSYGILGGFAEIIKSALVADPDLWKKLVKSSLPDHPERITNGSDLEDLASSAVAIKCRIVGQDFREKNIREVLNFGHTIGHAFESVSLQKNRKTLSHGHAVAMGMICESWLSVERTGLSANDRDTIIRLILPAYNYYPLTKNQEGRMMNFIWQDKKRRGSGLRFTLLKSPGHAITGISCEPGEISEAIGFYRTLEHLRR